MAALSLRLALVAAAAVCLASAQQQQQQQRPRVSDQQLDRALADKRYLTRQLKCALGEAPCDPVGRRLKTLAPLVLRGACPTCTPEETRQIQRTLSHIQRNYPKEWSKLVKQYAGF
uniref:Chemosensory protein 22 n=1 Tax=Oedaleus infernalis TaxID=267432 RepID=A0A3G2LGG4_9ORTH|nr:chemosensory protein 22 [Oedaleus infernalis]